MYSYKSLIQQYDVISFDLFDTLFYRKVYQPTDIFMMMKEGSFKNSRVTLERQARKKYANKVELTLNEIYDVIPNKEVLINIEKETEKDFIVINESIRELLDYANSINKTIILASDMYLDKEFIENILKENNIKYNKLYLSSELNIVKHSGEMWKYIISDFKDKKIVHFDDRKDLCVKAEVYGIKAINVPLRRNSKKIEYLKEYVDKKDFSAYSALVSQNNHKQDNFWFNIGYDYIGVTTLAILNKINEFKKELDYILFLSRDGFLFNEVYSYYREENDPKNIYFPTNRWLQKCFCLDNDFDINNSCFKDLIEYFKFLNLQDTNSLAEYINIENSIENKILKCSWTNANKDFDKNLQEFIEANFDKIKKECLQIKNNYAVYLNKFKGKRLGIVDLGWNGTCLEFFDKAGLNVVKGAYFCYFGKDNRIEQVYSEDTSRGRLWNYFSINILENLYCANHGSYKSLKLYLEGKEITEHFEEEVNTYDSSFYNNRKKIFMGAGRFITDFIDIQKKYNIKISEELLKVIYNRLFNNPTLEEAEKLGSILHYNGTEPTYVAKPSELAILNPTLLRIEYKNSTWKDGYKKILKDKYNIDFDKDIGINEVNDYELVINKFVEENRNKKIVCIGAGSFADYLIKDTKFKELNTIFLDNYKVGLVANCRPIFNFSKFKAYKMDINCCDICIWTMENIDNKLEEQYKELNPIKIF